MLLLILPFCSTRQIKTLQDFNNNEEPFFLLESDLIQSKQIKHKRSRVVAEIATVLFVMSNSHMSCSHNRAGVAVATMVSDYPAKLQAKQPTLQTPCQAQVMLRWQACGRLPL